jgi:SAM-dependent methyltransferase
MDPSTVAAHWEANAEAWTRHSRAGYDVYRDALNTPAFLAMLPPIAGLAGLDIGCGEGANTRQVAGLGARMQGIDIAPTFIRHAAAAETAEPLGIAYRLADATALPFADCSFDFATAFMSLMDLPDPALAVKEAQRVLLPGGFLQFSILHPCFVPAHRKVLRDAGQPRAIEIGGYFDRVNGRIDTWWFEALSAEQRRIDAPFRTPRFHRTLAEWVDIALAAGLAIEKMIEPSASEELAKREPVVADTRIAPISLIVRLRKPR